MKLVIFDCDGTLLDSQHGIVAAMTQALSDAGLAPLPREQVLSGVGLSLDVAVRRLLVDADEATVNQVAAGYRDAFRAMRVQPDFEEPLYSGILDLIHMLSKREDTLLGVATGKSRRGMTALFERLDLGRHFITVQTADTHPSKPHPSMIETALAEAGVNADRAVMVGDTTFDIEMGSNAGVVPIGVEWGYHPVAALQAAGAHAVVRDASGLLHAIDDVLKRA